MPDTYVLVHGAWHTGAEMEATATHLRARGHTVHCPTLAGNNPSDNRAATGLADAVDSLAAFIDSQGLTDVRLVGHSYGGMVITGVADRIPERIKRLVYLDAFVPVDGESVMTIRKAGALPIEKMTKDGFIIPGWVRPGQSFPKDVPHPLKTFTDPIVLKNPAAAKVPATYILTVDKGKRPEDDDFYPSAERAKARGWPVIIMEGDHVVNWRQPEATAALLLGLP